MEHRCTQRRKATRDVLIHTRVGLILRGFLRNVSREGMFIKTDVQRIRKNDFVDIEISSCICIRGWIIHISDEGVGVLFISPLANSADVSSPPIPLPDTCLRCLEIDEQYNAQSGL